MPRAQIIDSCPSTILLVTAGSFVVEREVATQAVVKLVNHYTQLTSDQQRTALASIRDWLQARGKITLAAIPLLLWGVLKFLRTLIRTTNRVWRSPTYNWWRLPLRSLGLLGITASAVLIGILAESAVVGDPAGETRLSATRHLDARRGSRGRLPQGIPVTMLDGKLRGTHDVGPVKRLPAERPHDEPDVSSTKAEGGLSSEAGVIKEQARQVQPLNEGENLLKVPSGTPPANEEATNHGDNGNEPGK